MRSLVIFLIVISSVSRLFCQESLRKSLYTSETAYLSLSTVKLVPNNAGSVYSKHCFHNRSIWLDQTAKFKDDKLIRKYVIPGLIFGSLAGVGLTGLYLKSEKAPAPHFMVFGVVTGGTVGALIGYVVGKKRKVDYP